MKYNITRDKTNITGERHRMVTNATYTIYSGFWPLAALEQPK